MANFWKNKKVLVTGHTGFKGSWLSLWLESLGAQVTGFSLPPSTNPNLYSLSKLENKIQSSFGDIRDFLKFKEFYEQTQPEIVFHLAAQALVRPSYKDPVGTYATNVMGTVHILETVRQVPCARVVVNVTSDKCYENREWAWGYRENEAMGGYDPYSSSKGCAELVTSAFRRSYFSGKLGIASARAGNVIGGGDWSEDRLIPDCVQSLLKNEPISIRNPNSIRPWQHVLEPLSGYMLLAEKLWSDPHQFSEAFNFGPDSSQAKPVHWIADRITHLWGPQAKWERTELSNQPHEAHFLKLDCSLAQSKLGWEPRLNLAQTLEWVVDWYKRLKNQEPAEKITLEQIQEFEKLGQT